MLYPTIAKTGDELSILGFECMRLPGDGVNIDEPRVMEQIRYAIDRGVNYLDTAFPYHGGTCEPFLGRALTDGYREKIKLATKLRHWITNSREDMDRILDSQLDRLQTNSIDYYLLHSLQHISRQQLRHDQRHVDGGAVCCRRARAGTCAQSRDHSAGGEGCAAGSRRCQAVARRAGGQRRPAQCAAVYCGS